MQAEQRRENPLSSRHLLSPMTIQCPALTVSIFTGKLECEETTSGNTERRQLLSEAITIGTIQTSVHVRQQLVQGFIQLYLVLGSLRTQQMILVCSKARFTGEHQAQHGTHHCPMVLRRTKEQQIEEGRSQTREKVWLCRKVLSSMIRIERCVRKDHEYNGGTIIAPRSTRTLLRL